MSAYPGSMSEYFIVVLQIVDTYVEYFMCPVFGLMVAVFPGNEEVS